MSETTQNSGLVATSNPSPRTAIPESVMEAANALRRAVVWQSNGSVEIIARAIMAAKAEQREADALIAENNNAFVEEGAYIAAQIRAGAIT